MKLDPSHLIAVGRSLGELAATRESLDRWVEGLEESAERAAKANTDSDLRVVHAKINAIGDLALTIHEQVHKLKAQLPPAPPLPTDDAEGRS